MGRRIGAGGEAEVFAVAGGLAYKRYHRASAARSRKLEVMVEHPPDVPIDVSVAWPQALVGTTGDVKGFLMAEVGGGTAVPLVGVYNPQNRARMAPGFTWQYLLRTALNVARTVEALHAAGYLVGDLNESNLLVDRRARVALVDCDSIQVRDPASGEVFTCPVGRPEYLAPELHRVDLSTAVRTEAGDAFALAVLVFHLLMEGRHPYAGRWRGTGDPPDVAVRMREGAWPYRRLDPRASPPPLGLPLSVLPPPLRRLVRRSFAGGARRPHARPTVGEWADALEEAERRLRPCRRSDRHVVPHGRRCPWCRRVDAGLPDPFPSSGGGPVQPRRRAQWSGRMRASARAVLSRGLRLTARALPLALAAAVGGAAWPVVAPVAASVLVIPVLVAVSAPADPPSRRRFDLRRGVDRLLILRAHLSAAARTGLGAGAWASGGAAAGAAAGLAVVGGGAWGAVRSASAAVLIGQLLFAPRIAATWEPMATAWDRQVVRAPRATAVATWVLAAAVVVASRTY